MRRELYFYYFIILSFFIVAQGTIERELENLMFKSEDRLEKELVPLGKIINYEKFSLPDKILFEMKKKFYSSYILEKKKYINYLFEMVEKQKITMFEIKRGIIIWKKMELRLHKKYQSLWHEYYLRRRETKIHKEKLKKMILKGLFGKENEGPFKDPVAKQEKSKKK